jgi:rhodanese-related sulfurtransferase
VNQLISPRELRAQLAGQTPPTVIDVRSEEEYRAGHIAGALHVPADDVEQFMAQTPRDRPVVPY